MTSRNHNTPWTIKVSAEHRLHHLRKLFQREIEGVSAKRAELTESISRRDAYDFVPKDERGQAFPAIWLGAYNASDHLVGALYMHTPYEELLEIGNGFDRDLAKGVGKVRRTLASIAVVEDMRRTGLGRHYCQLVSPKQGRKAPAGLPGSWTNETVLRISTRATDTASSQETPPCPSSSPSVSEKRILVTSMGNGSIRSSNVLLKG